ncbi:MAG: hypothetical protein ACR2PG_07125 [Hyphomicrobiaceae bacterium]
MLSFVDIEPDAIGTLPHYPEDQWVVLLEGSGVRVQGDVQIAVKKGDFRRTSGKVPQSLRAGPEGRLSSISSARHAAFIARPEAGLEALSNARRVSPCPVSTTEPGDDARGWCAMNARA